MCSKLYKLANYFNYESFQGFIPNVAGVQRGSQQSGWQLLRFFSQPHNHKKQHASEENISSSLYEKSYEGREKGEDIWCLMCEGT
jgi:hypothetical protein